MGRFRVLVTAVVAFGSWVLNATSVVSGNRLLIAAAVIAFAMLVWAEIDRHEERKGRAELKRRIAVLADAGDRKRPQWYPDYSIHPHANRTPDSSWVRQVTHRRFTPIWRSSAGVEMLLATEGSGGGDPYRLALKCRPSASISLREYVAEYQCGCVWQLDDRALLTNTASSPT